MEKDPLSLGFIVPLLPKFLLTVEMGKAVSREQELGSSAAEEGTGYRHVRSSRWLPQQRGAAISHPPSFTAARGGIPSGPESHTHHHVFIFKYILSADFAEQLSWEVQMMLRNKFKDIVLPARERENN